jgi:hypothetical protein
MPARAQADSAAALCWAAGAVLPLLDAVGDAAEAPNSERRESMNAELLHVSAGVAIASSDQSTRSAMLDEPSLARMWTIETAEFESLPEVEQARLGVFVGMQLVAFYRNYYFKKDGVVRDQV